MSRSNKDIPLRILIIGASESNRRRYSSYGVKANMDWAQELERRYAVSGYWPTFFMHQLESQIYNIPFPCHKELQQFGKGQYLYDRRFIYKWKHTEMWNIAMPGNIARLGLYHIKSHREILKKFSPDITIICIGSVDCLENSVTLPAINLTEIHKVSNLNSEDSLQFNYCQTPDEFYDILVEFSEIISWISQGRTVLHLDVIPGNMNSRLQKQRFAAFGSVVKMVSQKFDHKYITYPFLNEHLEDMNHWYRHDDGHPTDSMNAHIANTILDNITISPFTGHSSREYPVPTINVSDWTQEAAS